MKKILLDKKEIVAAIEKGDNCEGRYFLKAEDGKSSVVWISQNRRKENDAEYFAIPALSPDGSGRESEDAAEMLRDLCEARPDEMGAMRQTWQPAAPIDDSFEFISAYRAANDVSWSEISEKFFGEDWETNRENALEFLAEEFLNNLNDASSEFYLAWNAANDCDARREPRYECAWEE